MSLLSPRALLRLSIPLALAATLAGCGGSDDDDAGASSSASTPAVASTSPATAGPQASHDSAAVDAAFVREMIPHHELAIEMASYGKSRADHPELKFLVKRISTTQRAEIATMTSAAKRLGVKLESGRTMDHGQSAKDAATLGIAASSTGMSMDATSLKTARPFDEAFLKLMIPHHVGAIAMARAEEAHGGDAELKKVASSIADTQNSEIVQMTQWQLKWYPAATTSK